MKRALALSALAVAAASGIALAAPASAAGGCATIEGSVNGTALPVNGTYCTPEVPPVPALP